MVPDARDLRWIYECHTAQIQHYSMHLMQETGENEDFGEAGHTVNDKSSGYAWNDATNYATMAQNLTSLNVNSLHAVILDVVLDTDNVLSAAAHEDEPTLPSKVDEIPILGEAAMRRNQDSSGLLLYSSLISVAPVSLAHDQDQLTDEVVKRNIFMQHLQRLHLTCQQQPKDNDFYEEAFQMYKKRLKSH